MTSRPGKRRLAKLARKVFAAGTVLAALMAVLGSTSPAAAVTKEDPGKTTTSGLQAHPGVRLIWKSDDGRVVKTDDDDDLNCPATRTCITCEVFAFPPWPGSAPIVNARGEVHCYYPDQGWVPAQVLEISLRIVIWDAGDDRVLHFSNPPLDQANVSQLGLTDAMPAIPASNCGSGFMQTVVIVDVAFPNCCPWFAHGEFGSDVRRISC